MANDLNSVVLVGHLTRDMELSYLQSGTAVGKIPIAVNRSKKQGDQWIDEVSYFEVALFGKSAENLKLYLLKGKQIAVHGTLKQDRWEKDGEKHSRVSILCNNIQLLGGHDSGNSNGNGGNKIAPNRGDTFTPDMPTESFPEDIPF
jgi:single-strand DNA-binding protein